MDINTEFESNSNTYQIKFSHEQLEIIFGINESPNDFDIIFMSSDVYGTHGILNKSILTKLKLQNYINDNKAILEGGLKKGYHWLNIPNSVSKVYSIVYIVTIVPNEETSSLLASNLTKAISSNITDLTDRKVWIPLMGTGKGKLSYEQSTTITLDVLEKITREKNLKKKNIVFHVALPNKAKEIWDDLKNISFEILHLDDNDQQIFDVKEKILASKNKNHWLLRVHPDMQSRKLSEGGFDIGYETGYDYLSRDFSDTDQELLKELEHNDLIIGYISDEQRRISYLFEVKIENSEDIKSSVRFKLLYFIKNNTRLDDLLNYPGSAKMFKQFVNENPPLVKLTFNQFKEIINTTELGPIEEESKSKPKPKNEVVPAYTDNPEKEDQLGRLPIAKSIVAVVKNIWGDSRSKSKKYGWSFMINIQGSWGSGKSTFLNLIESELKKENWVVVNYNAWQHQHIDPPWWSLLDNVYLEAKKQINKKRCCFKINELWRRWKSGNIVLNILTVVFFIITVMLFILLIPKISIQENNWLNNLSIVLTLIGGVAITLFSFFKNISHSLLGGSSKSADSFTNLSKDPMDRIKKHFQKLVIGVEQHVAIFIDDLDRCEPDFTVKLLEGIQTLFRDTQVLYVVAADKNWIAKCFEIHYDNFRDTVTQSGTRLGYLFIQKAFQLSVRMPVLTNDKIKNYWDYLLRIKEEDQQAINKEELSERFSLAQNEEQVRKIANNLVAEKALPETIIFSAAVDKLNEQKFIEATEHELQRFAAYLEPNPRSIKRLANFYNVFNRTLLLEGKELDTSVKVRWLLLSQRWPILADELENHPEIIDDSTKKEKEEIKRILELQEVKDLTEGKNGDGKLNKKDIMDCIGWIDDNIITNGINKS